MPAVMTRSDPVCGTCRKKSRKCDRKRPVCQRCITKGLVCEGYETKFKVYDFANGSKKRKTFTETIPTAPTKATRSRRQKSPPPALSDCPSLANSISPGHSSSTSESSSFEPLSSTSTHIRSVDVDSLDGSAKLEDVLAQDSTKKLLSHFDTNIAEAFIITPGEGLNPFRTYILPLAYQHLSLLHAVLGLSACHISKSEFPNQSTAAIAHKLFAIQSISSFLLKEEVLGLKETEEDLTLAIVLLLLLQDICETGISSHGAHLNGVSFLCARIASRGDSSNKMRNFLIASLAWFDMLRGISGAEKLAFPSSIRDYISETSDFGLETMIGCPTYVFAILGKVLDHGKLWYHHEITQYEFQEVLDELEQALLSWDSTATLYPTRDPAWPSLADAFRQLALLRIRRWPDTSLVPCDAPQIKDAVGAIFDACASIPATSPLYKRLIFPLFMAAADTNSKHQYHYARMNMSAIKRITWISQPALCDLQGKVWNARQETPKDRNVPWMNFTCSATLQRQHDYLIL